MTHTGKHDGKAYMACFAMLGLIIVMGNDIIAMTPPAPLRKPPVPMSHTQNELAALILQEKALHARVKIGSLPIPEMVSP